MKLSLKTIIAVAALAAAPLMTNAQAAAPSLGLSNATLIQADYDATSAAINDLGIADLNAAAVTQVKFHGHRGFRGSRSFRGNRGFRSSNGFRGNRGFRSSRGFRGSRGFSGRGRGGFRR